MQNAKNMPGKPVSKHFLPDLALLLITKSKIMELFHTSIDYLVRALCTLRLPHSVTFTACSDMRHNLPNNVV